MFFRDTPNPELKDLVEGKRIAVVGPAHYLTGKSQGSFIDDYDIIVRINQFTVKKDLYTDYGSRTDIMFHNCGKIGTIGLKEQVEQNPGELDKLKMVVCPIIKADHSETNFHLWPDDHISACAYNFQTINTEIPFYWIGVRNYLQVYRVIGCQPYTGVMAIITLMHYPIKELYITGFDFYTGDRIYSDGYLASIDAAYESEAHGGTHGHGCNISQLRFLKNLHGSSARIFVDNKLENIFSKV